MKRVYFIIGVICILLTGCFKDEGNYVYQDINEVEISGLPEEMKIYYRNADTLKAFPEVAGNLDAGDHSRYYYEWKAISKPQPGSATTASSYVIGTEKQLNYFVVLPDDEYDVYCCVKDTLTRVTWKSSFPIKVTTVLNAGWLVLSEVNDNCKLDLISLSAKDNVVVRDVFEDFPVLHGPKALQSVFNMNNAQFGTDPRFYLLSESGCYKLDISDYKWDETTHIRYEMMEYPENFTPGLRASGYGWELVLARNMVYGVNKPFGEAGPFGLPCNHLTDSEETFEVAEAVGFYPHYYFSNGARVLYDITNKRFVKLASNMLSCEEITATASYFPWTTGKDFVYMTSTPYDGGTTYTILEDPGTHKRYLYSMKIATGITQRKFLPLEDAPEIEKAEHFAVYPASNWLYYSVGNRVYQYDMNGHSATPIALEDESVTFLKFHIFTGLSSDAKIQGQLVVGSIDLSSSELNGNVRFYQIPTSWEEKFEEPEPYTHFGRPVDIVYTQK